MEDGEQDRAAKRQKQTSLQYHAAQEASRVFFRLVEEGALDINNQRVKQLEAHVCELADRVNAFEAIVPQCSWPENRHNCCGDGCENSTKCSDFNNNDCADHYTRAPCSECQKEFCEECLVECEDDSAKLCHDCYEEHYTACLACIQGQRGW